jgi:flagellar biosynthesis GTPase FlhF
MERTQFTFYESFAKALARIKKKTDRADAYDAICNYALYGIEPDFALISDSVAIAFELIRPNLDASKRKAENGKRGGATKQTASKTEANASKAEANTSKTKQSASEKENEREIESEKENEKENEIEKEKEYECTLSKSLSRETLSPALRSAQPVRHKHGKYGWVLLTDEQYDRLVGEYGLAKVDAAVAYIDESAQQTGNKNKWKDWNLTVRKCIREGWGQRKAQTVAASQPVAGNPFDALRREVLG